MNSEVDFIPEYISNSVLKYLLNNESSCKHSESAGRGQAQTARGIHKKGSSTKDMVQIRGGRCYSISRTFIPFSNNHWVL